MGQGSISVAGSNTGGSDIFASNPGGAWVISEPSASGRAAFGCFVYRSLFSCKGIHTLGETIDVSSKIRVPCGPGCRMNPVDAGEVGTRPSNFMLIGWPKYSLS